MIDRPAASSNRDVALFPLPDFILYPGTVQSLRVFEPRYVSMIEDLLDAPGLLVMGTVLGENRRHLDDDDTPVEAVGTLAQILGYERQESGQYLISVLGLVRVMTSPAKSCRPYRKVSVNVVDGGPESSDEEELRSPLQQALESRWSSESDLPVEPPVSQLADLLLLHLGLTAQESYQLYSIQPTLQRVQAILERHEATG